jgi:hypothetical protein
MFAYLLCVAAEPGFRGYCSSTSCCASDFTHGLNSLSAEKVLACTGNIKRRDVLISKLAYCLTGQMPKTEREERSSLNKMRFVEAIVWLGEACMEALYGLRSRTGMPNI